MQSFTNRSIQGMTGQVSQVPSPFPGRRNGESLLSLDWLDTFVLNHSELGFREFFHRLQRLEQWHDLLSNFDALQEYRASSR